MKIGLIIVGDEVLSGRRTDAHLPKVIEMLKARNLLLSWVTVMGDSKDILDETYRRTLASDDLVFSTGGIGATPDDMTRESVARALGVPVERHPEGKLIIEEFMRQRNRTPSEERYRLIEFPRGARLIPNPVNTIPGFSVNHHHFVPGFPEMAWPMIEWVLDNHYAHLSENPYQERAVLVINQYESAMIPLLELTEQEHPRIKVFCLPMMDSEYPKNEIGVKGHPLDVKPAFEFLRRLLNEKEYEWQRLD